MVQGARFNLLAITALLALSGCGDDGTDPGDGGENPDTGFTCPDPRGCPTGCCDGTSCLDGDTLLSCGAEGDTCRPCADGGECIDGACRPPACEASCMGCCSETGCETGTSTGACGSAGSACIECIPGEECSAGACVCVPACGTRVCGPDGCGGECGAGCTDDEVCNAAGSGCEAPSCTSCGDCADEEACLFGRCQSPWGQTYRVTMIDGAFPAEPAPDECWDTTLGFGCGLPDPTVMVSSDESSWRVGCDDDTLMPTWEGTADLVIGRSDALFIRLVDEDVGGAFGCDGFTNDQPCVFHFSGPDHPGSTPESTAALRDIICTGAFDEPVGAVCAAGYELSFTIEAI